MQQTQCRIDLQDVCSVSIKLNLVSSEAAAAAVAAAGAAAVVEAATRFCKRCQSPHR